MLVLSCSVSYLLGSTVLLNLVLRGRQGLILVAASMIEAKSAFGSEIWLSLAIPRCIANLPQIQKPLRLLLLAPPYRTPISCH